MEDVDRGNETVTSLRERLNIAGAVCGVAEGFTDLIDGGAERVVEVDDGVSTPEAKLKILPGNDLTGTLEEHGENLKGLRLQLDPETSLPEFAALEIHLEEPEGEFRVGDRGRHLCEKNLAELTVSLVLSRAATVDRCAVSARRTGICQEIKN